MTERGNKMASSEPALGGAAVPEVQLTGVDWRVWLGLGLTALYLAIGVFHILVDVGWSDFRTQSMDSLGNFLEGAFAPLAFLWLVIGYFLQYHTLRENNHNIALQYVEMRKASEHTAEQARALIASERHSRQASFVKLVELVNNQLGVTAGLLFLANQRSSGLEADQDPLSATWARVAEGDSGVFSRKLIELCYGPSGRRREAHRVFDGTSARRRYTAQFVQTFEALLAEARGSDFSGLLVEALVSGNAHGHLYRTIQDYRSYAEVRLKRAEASEQESESG